MVHGKCRVLQGRRTRQTVVHIVIGGLSVVGAVRLAVDDGRHGVPQGQKSSLHAHDRDDRGVDAEDGLQLPDRKRSPVRIGFESTSSCCLAFILLWLLLLLFWILMLLILLVFRVLVARIRRFYLGKLHKKRFSNVSTKCANTIVSQDRALGAPRTIPSN